MQNRCFENTPNYDDDDERFLRRKISETLAHLWNSSLKHANLPRDCVYDGKAGELYWLTQMCALYPDSLPGLYEKSKAICETLIKTIQKHQSSFQRHANDTSLLCGLAGQVLAVWHHLQIFQPEHTFVEECLDIYWKLCTHSIATESTTNEILYGRAGLLMGATTLARSGRDNVSCRGQMIRRLLRDGKDAFESKDHSPPLVYAWHGKQYIGAAHGYAGILAALFANWSEVPAIYHNDIRKTLDWMLSLITSNVNMPSSMTDRFRVRSGKDQLVHWCHGAPGIIPTLCLAYSVFGETKYLDRARHLAETVWQYGLIRKGWGLCHGAPGNGYAFLALYNATQDYRYLRYAKQFGYAVHQIQKSIVNVPDEPLGLYTGVCGGGIFLLDIMTGTSTSAFPFLVTGPADGKIM